MRSPTFPCRREAEHIRIRGPSVARGGCDRMMGPRKGLKVTDAERKTRVGIAVETLEDLKRKTVEKFKLSQQLDHSQVVFQTRDGRLVRTEADFGELKPQTLLIWVKKGERAETDAEILYKTIREVNLDFLTTGEKVQEFFTEQMKTKVYKLAEVLKGLEDDRAKFSSRQEDADWFEGVDSRSKTKEEYMFRRSQDRIRTYFYRTKDELLKRAELPNEQLGGLLLELQGLLKAAAYFGCYFHRGEMGGKICDGLGRFTCQGRWDQDGCLYNGHQINPYRSREDRIVFQTWNLDHRIERSRMIIPAICRALESAAAPNAKGKFTTIDVEQIFEDLFTTRNLKLVQIICHDKGAHEKVDLDRYIKYN